MIEKRLRAKLSELSRRSGGRLDFDHPLGDHTTIRIGGRADAWYEPASQEDLREVIMALRDFSQRFMVMGNGSNTLVPDDGLDAVVIKLSAGPFVAVEARGRMLSAGAGASIGGLIIYSCNAGLSGLEGLAGIPGTVGGAVVTNASYRGSISDRLKSITVMMPGGEVDTIEKKDLFFAYRHSSVRSGEIILKANFLLEETDPADIKRKTDDFLKEKRARQPLHEKTLGCVFKNAPDVECSSGEMIEKTGFKGHRSGGAQVSEKHANFIVNTGGASAKDVISLMEEIKVKVRERFSVELEPEIKIIG